jgi:hypothetical protein
MFSQDSATPRPDKLCGLPKEMLCLIVSYLQVSELPSWFCVNQRLHALDCFLQISRVHLPLHSQLHKVMDPSLTYRTLFREQWSARNPLPKQPYVDPRDSLDEYVFTLDVRPRREGKTGKPRSLLVRPHLVADGDVEVVFTEEESREFLTIIAKENEIHRTLRENAPTWELFISNPKTGRTNLLAEGGIVEDYEIDEKTGEARMNYEPDHGPAAFNRALSEP